MTKKIGITISFIKKIIHIIYVDNMLNTAELRQDTKDSISGILWFLTLVPVAMGMHYFAKFYEIMGFTILGWFVATMGAVQLGFALARGGPRLFRFPLRSARNYTS
ncbi:MAG: hypothetical protein ACXAE3_00600 [Candidatus Kariarchaeaceae archaeon]|jgi:hypothetical protein